MSRIKNHYRRWLLERLPQYDKLLVLGAVLWLKWCEDLNLPIPDLKAPAPWTSPAFFFVGLAGYQYYRLNEWWKDLLINWVLRQWLQQWLRTMAAK